MSRSKLNETSSKSSTKLQNSVEELHEHVNALKETVISQSNIMEISELKVMINNLKETTNSLKNIMEISQGQIKDLKETVVSQNKIIVGLVSEVKVMVKSNIIPGQVSVKYSELFPITSQDELKEIEDEITDETKYAMVATIKNILNPGGLTKSLVHILHMDILLKYNVDGKQGKQRILDFPKFVDSIYKALFTEGLSKKMFLNDLRKAFRLTKNRHYKNACVQKVISANNKFLISDEEESHENQDPMQTLM